ncbi:MAG: DegT/DnrJ/EryC1/StrS family aminotransferase [Armatimonadota bacterium]|nr:DegT/DnrJ/EryC1/StrS family aminotransferase [Armatimonadota bacterium]
MATLALLGGQPVRTRPFPPWPEFGAPEEETLVGVLRSGHWGRTTGSWNQEFERRFAAYQHAARAVTCVNGTVALELALRAAGIGPNDEVIVPSYTFIATASAALHLGAVPVFADIEPTTYTISVDSAADLASARTRAIVPVHLAGAPADMDGILILARERGLVVIEDAAQAHGAEWQGQRVGAIGALGAFSFQATKVLTAGEGGAVVTNDTTLAEAVWSLQNVGRIPGGDWYEHHRLGWNLRMTEFQAALLLAQMDRLDEQIARRARNAAALDAVLREIEGVEPLTYPSQITRHPRYLYVFRYRSQAFGGLPKSRFVEALVAEGIPAMPGYPPLHSMSVINEALASRGVPLRAGRNGALPATERAWKDEAVWLPQTVLLGTHEDVADVGRAVRKIAAHHQELR